MSSSKRVFSGVFWSTLGSLINALYGFFSVPILLVHFGKQEYALIGLALSVNVYLRLMDMGFSSGNVKFFSTFLVKKEFDKLNRLFGSSLVFYGGIGILNAIVLGIVAFFSEGIFSLSHDQAIVLHNMFYVLMISAFFGWISSLLDQFLKANEIIGWEQRLVIFSKLLQVLILYLTVKYDYSLSSFFALTTFSALVILPFSIMKINTLPYKISYWPSYDHGVFKQVLPYAISIFSFSIFQFSAAYLRPLILSLRTSLEAIADFRILEGFANMIMLLGTSFVGVILPLATKVTATGDKVKELKIAHDGTKYITIFLSVVVFGFLLVSKDLMVLYVGKNYLYLVPWLNMWVITLLGTHNSALSSLVLSGNDLKKIVYISAFSTIVSLGLAWFLTPMYQVGGVVIGYLVYIVIQCTFYYVYYYPREMGLDSGKIFTRSFFLPASGIALSALVVFFGAQAIHFTNAYVKIISIGMCYLVIVAPVIYFAIFNKQDKQFLLHLLKFK